MATLDPSGYKNVTLFGWWIHDISLINNQHWNIIWIFSFTHSRTPKPNDTYVDYPYDSKNNLKVQCLHTKNKSEWHQFSQAVQHHVSE
ncbi:hypothetical protein DASC09_042100 [Saccharomycopsis crataegensis]|uniref:Uncharacterized protein n=1 Tax=Saccharomycopsis crataegensis TaxID=43959 RepID=A0AAV5QQR9_9ASCO|nr:hypothetical protein DASC09_042100 [Saccharomycopsis crataegensis]